MSLPTILIVEDDVFLHRVLRFIFKEYDLMITTSVFEALPYLETVAALDLVIVDMLMPGLSGIDFMLLVKEKGLDFCPVYVLSEVAEDELIRGILKAGANRFYNKSKDMIKLREDVKRLFTAQQTVVATT